MRLSDYSIATRLFAGLGLVLALMMTLAAFAVQDLQRLASLVEVIHQHPLTVSNAALAANLDILRMQRDLADAVGTGPDPTRVAEVLAKAAAAEASAVEQLRIVRRNFLGDISRVEEIQHLVTEWGRLREEIGSLLAAGNDSKALERAVDRARMAMGIIKRDLDYVLAYARQRADQYRAEAVAARDRATLHLGLIAVTTIGIAFLVALLSARSIVRPLAAVAGALTRLTAGDRHVAVPGRGRSDEIGAVAEAAHVFRKIANQAEEMGWIKGEATRILARIQGTTSLADFGRILLAELVPVVGGGVGSVHIVDADTGILVPCATFGLPAGHAAVSFAPGEGLVGQCALTGQALTVRHLPDDYVSVVSGTGGARAGLVTLHPVPARDRVLGVMEIAAFAEFTPAQAGLIEELLPIVGLALETLERTLRTRDLLQATQAQAEELRTSEEELQAQGEELRSLNEQLMAQTRIQQQQAERLQTSETLLLTANQALTEKAKALEDQARILEDARRMAANRADEVEQASRYKSEFLANMSHELRTPLNSLLILARSLAENQEANLDAEQIESARIIVDSGTQLLDLINNILDLSKVEAGRMDLVIDEVPVADLALGLARRFRHVAADRGLAFSVDIAAADPVGLATLRCDVGKLNQIIANLVANALKFTETGGVQVVFASEPATVDGGPPGLVVSVTDTGIGIAPGTLRRIFAPFEQADGSTSRRYGGTGLGLSIADRLTQLLGGRIDVDSTPDVGSTFRLHMPGVLVPVSPPGTGSACDAPASGPEALAPAAGDETGEPPRSPVPDRDGPTAPRGWPDAFEAADPLPAVPADGAGGAERLILVIEDDTNFRTVLCGLAQRKGFRSVAAANGETGVELAARLRPLGIILDIGLPGMNGWSVIDRLKENPVTRDIPVHVISGADGTGGAGQGLERGAIGYLAKPVDRGQIETALDRIAACADGRSRRLLVVDPDVEARGSLARLVGADVEVTAAATGADALALLATQRYDCMILDLRLPDMSGIEFVGRVVATTSLPPLVVYTEDGLSRDDALTLREYTDSIVIKGPRSQERLLDEVTLFLHSVRIGLPTLRPSPPQTDVLDDDIRDRTVLVVDDDMRNAFALSRALRAHGLHCLIAQDGHKALAHLAEGEQKVDIVLMDIMMPGLDGYETTRAIRAQSRLRSLPVIAVTAKAMSGDREKCLNAGANDYLTKPIDIDRLMSMMRVWLHGR